METINLGYSTKNIPISNKDSYRTALIAQTESFLRRLRWKVHFFLSKSDTVTSTSHLGFNSLCSPPKNQLLYQFENDMYDMVKNVEFEPVNLPFQKKMSVDLKAMRSSGKVYVQADKTKNIYSVDPGEYMKLLKDNVTRTYKKSNLDELSNVNSEACSITESLKISDRVQCIAGNEAFVTIKDHKPNFPNSVECRLLNPCKSEIGKISKAYLDSINTAIRQSLNLNQWRNTKSVIEWFGGIQQKANTHFIKFDIVSFYPSITHDVLMRALEFARSFCEVTPSMKSAILNSRKSFLFFKGSPWVKKDAPQHFDVTEGSFDGAEVCELVGLYLLNRLEGIVSDGSVGLYRDDGLAAVHGYSGPRMDKLRKTIVEVFKSNGFQITINIKLKVTDFLDVVLDLDTGKYWPFRKANDNPQYVHRGSNHPANILKEIPVMTNKRLSALSCDKEQFDKSAVEYERVLKLSGYKDKLAYKEPTQSGNRRRKKRNIL